MKIQYVLIPAGLLSNIGMSKRIRQSGQSLIEILFAIAIFTVGVLTIGYLIIDAQASLQKNIEFTQARLLASEGIEAVHSIRNADFNNLAVGTYGLELVDATWNLVQSEPDETSKFIRTITIEDINPKVKHVISTVVWVDGIGQAEHHLSFESYITSWTQDNTDAEALVLEGDAATTSPSGEEIIGLVIENTGSDEITITEIMGEWNTAYTVQNITIDGTEVFAVSTTTEAGVSGGTIDIEDYLLLPNEGPKTIDVIDFDGSMVGSTLTLDFILSDESSKDISLDF